jgi:hypothetical protein
MHIHTTQANAQGNALAGAIAEETATSLRRARELRETAAKLKAISTEITPEFLPNPPATQGYTRAASSQSQELPHKTSPVSFWA